MSKLAGLVPPELETVRFTVEPPDLLRLAGTIAIKDANERIGPFFRRVHDAFIGDPSRRFRVDVTALTFVNSSAIRLFVDWATWVRKEPAERQYELCFISDRSISWQRTNFAALVAIAKGVVVVTSK